MLKMGCNVVTTTQNCAIIKYQEQSFEFTLNRVPNFCKSCGVINLLFFFFCVRAYKICPFLGFLKISKTMMFELLLHIDQICKNVVFDSSSLSFPSFAKWRTHGAPLGHSEVPI